MGATAKIYITDREKASQFIHECFKQCHNKTAKQLWGEDLVKDIATYANGKVQSSAEVKKTTSQRVNILS